MPDVFDWQRVAEPHAVIQYAVQSLHERRTVAFPSANGYVLTASVLAPEAVGRLPVQGDGEALTLLLRRADEARDWIPDLTPRAQRLVRRLWPGAVILIVDGDIERGSVSRLPDEVRARLCVRGTLRLAMPEHEALREVLRRLPDPLLMVAIVDEASGVASAPRLIADVVVADDPPTSQPATVLAVHGDAWQIVREGAVSVEEIRRRTACIIVFVCTGNTCRSPLAEAMCKKQLAVRLNCAVEELPARGYHVVSAGLAASLGGTAAVEAEKVARDYGADLSAHRSQPLTPELAVDADYLVGMTHSHVHALTDYFGSAIVEPRLLDPSGDIADPIGGDRTIYDECGRQIWRQLDRLVAEILSSETPRP
jgi:protein-tyrosine-phosphatase/tRNA A37 threonylcarbamoyladenosine synthetase subunit TsaC/SUA5/YrdC